MGMKTNEWIDHSQLHKFWHQCVEWEVENLFVEILVHKQFNFYDPYYGFVVIGDLGARVLLYYASLEH